MVSRASCSADGGVLLCSLLSCTCAQAVPVLDMRLPESEAADILKEACESTGFFYRAPCSPARPSLPSPCISMTYARWAGQLAEAFALAGAVRHHGLEDLVQQQFQQSKEFFSQPLEFKHEIDIENTRFHRCSGRTSDTVANVVMTA